MSDGWMPCDRTDRHEPHDWLYVDPATHLAVVATCDGEPQPDREA